MAATRFKIEKFDGETNFNVASSDDDNSNSNLLEKGCYRKKSENLNRTKWEELDEKALSAIQLCLTNTVLQENVGVHIDDEYQTMLLLCSLSHSYKSFRETLIYGKDKLSFEDVKGHLLSRDKVDSEFGLDSKADRQASVL
ncbi:hypothetical protein Gotri_017148, partial [Gossypium trilobum]|nr:hypothetical protein [Gossypium trilobum]